MGLTKEVEIKAREQHRSVDAARKEVHKQSNPKHPPQMV